MPGGNTRHSIALAPYPVYVRRGQGCRVTDMEGEERIDFINNYTSLILGHADPHVVSAVHSQIDRGTAFSMPSALDVELAELLVDRVPYVEQIRFCNSGSEAILMAIKAARAFTGRPKIAKFEGAYHGIYDHVQVSAGADPENWGDEEAPAPVIEKGSASSLADEVVVLPWNHSEACRRLIHENRNHLAAVIVDALPGGIGMIAPQAGFLEMLRSETDRVGALFISDEVMSFRLAFRGAMNEYAIAPDLTTFGKIIGGGFPVGAVAGRAQVMSVFDHRAESKVSHGGTFNANPVTMTAGLATMRQMTSDAYERLNLLGDYLRDRLTRMFHDQGIPAQVCGKGSLFIAHLTSNNLVDFRSLAGFSRTNPAYGALCHAMLAHGILTVPRGLFGCLSTPMSEAEADEFVSAVRRSLISLNYAG